MYYISILVKFNNQNTYNIYVGVKESCGAIAAHMEQHIWVQEEGAFCRRRTGKPEGVNMGTGAFGQQRAGEPEGVASR